MEKAKTAEESSWCPRFSLATIKMMKAQTVVSVSIAADLRTEALQLLRLGQKIAESKKESVRFLAATKMHDARRQSKPALK
jgi:hypothetical protein